jgi:hypothetical protein
MAAKYTIKTRDLRVKFFEKSFQITNHFPNVFLGREIPKQEGQSIADMLQQLVEMGKHPKSWQHHSRGLRGKVIDHEDEENWQAQEIAGLKDEIEELKNTIQDYSDNVHWLEGQAITGGEGWTVAPEEHEKISRPI